MEKKKDRATMHERQPLLSSVPVAPQRPRYRYATLARALALGFAAGLAVLFVVLFFVPSWKPLGASSLEYTEWPQERVPLDDLKALLLETPDPELAREWSQYYTAGPHLAGKNLSQAVWTKEKMEEFGIPNVEIVSYDIYTNYPVSSRLGLFNESGLLYEAQLEEDVLEEDPTSSLENRVPTFHGYSASGNVTAEYVFANYGTYRDFEDLAKQGVDVSGKIVLCRYGIIFRGLKVKRAQELGAVGVLIYSDPGDDGGVTAHEGYEEYPNGPARHPSAVQRGSVQFLSTAPGDPTTIGYPSKPGVPRQNPNGTIPEIPSLPISYRDALPLLQALNGYGLNASDLGGDWGSGGLYHKGVTYNIGPAPNVTVNLVNEVEYVITPQWDVIAVINGSIKDETVLIGNHRDAWIAGGAVDPNSGSAALIELSRSFGKLLQSGWKPLRTIVLASWDGEEYGLLGSTEWVEDFAPWLHTTALAYLNVDVGVRTSAFATAANPLLYDVIHSATKQVDDPQSVERNESKPVFDVWDKKIRTLGSGSDYTAFQDHIGIPSVDMGFSGYVENAPVYQYHSNYDSFNWMDNFGDPGFKYHAAVTKIWGLMVLDLVETPVVRFNATSYAASLHDYLQRIKKRLAEAEEEDSSLLMDVGEVAFRGHLLKLEKVIDHLVTRASKFDAYAAKLGEELKEDIPCWKWWKKAKLLLQVRKVNQQYKYLDRAFLYHGGLDNRSWFKHVVYAPGRWTGYAGDVFPGLVESIEDKDWKNAARWTHIIGRSVHRATVLLH